MCCECIMNTKRKVSISSFWEKITRPPSSSKLTNFLRSVLRSYITSITCNINESICGINYRGDLCSANLIEAHLWLISKMFYILNNVNLTFKKYLIDCLSSRRVHFGLTQGR